MSTTTASRPTIVKWGWITHLVMTALLSLNGILLFLIGSQHGVFEEDTGVPREEVEALFPTVVDQVVREGQLVAILLAILGLFAFVVALGGYRQDSPVAWNSMWMLVAALGALGAGLTAGGGGRIGVIYIVGGAILLLGQLLIQRGLKRRDSRSD